MTDKRLANMSDFGRKVWQYARAIGNHGVGSGQALRLRAKHAKDERFLEYANALDGIKGKLAEGKKK